MRWYENLVLTIEPIGSSALSIWFLTVAALHILIYLLVECIKPSQHVPFVCREMSSHRDTSRLSASEKEVLTSLKWFHNEIQWSHALPSEINRFVSSTHRTGDPWKWANNKCRVQSKRNNQRKQNQQKHIKESMCFCLTDDKLFLSLLSHSAQRGVAQMFRLSWQCRTNNRESINHQFRLESKWI